MNRSSVFQWHKRFKEGRESLRDDERCGRSREVRTSEMIGQINDFMNRDRRVSIETHYIEVLREFRKTFRRKRPELFESGQWHFYQDNAPVHKSILVTRLFDPDGHQDGSPSSLQPGPCSLRLLAIPKAQGKPQRQSLFHN